MNHSSIDFYFDIISPYTYIAWSRLPGMIDQSKHPIIIKPILFSALLNYHGQLGPAEIEAKRAYTFTDIYRLGQFYNCPVQGPPAHPFKSLIPLRLILCMDSEEKRHKMTDLLLMACWRDGKDVVDQQVLSELILQVGEDPAVIANKMNSQSIKDELKSNGEEAIKKGIFGVPSFLVNDEIFWGNDRIELMAAYLEGNIGVDREFLATIIKRPRAIDRKAFLARKP